jgi:hypothetical protein
VTEVVQHEPQALRAARAHRCDEILAGNLTSVEYVAELDLHNLQLGDERTMSVLARIGHMARLRALRIGFNVLRAGAMRALSASPLSAQLEELDLTGNHLGNEGIAALFAGAFPRLAVLGLGWCSLSDGAAGPIASAASFPALRDLSIRRNRFTDAGARRLASSPALRAQLTRLNVDYNDDMTSRGVTLLSKAYGDALVM